MSLHLCFCYHGGGDGEVAGSAQLLKPLDVWASFDHPFHIRSMKLADGLPPVCQECAKTRSNEPQNGGRGDTSGTHDLDISGSKQPYETRRMLHGTFTHQWSAVRYRPRPPRFRQVEAVLGSRWPLPNSVGAAAGHQGIAHRGRRIVVDVAEGPQRDGRVMAAAQWTANVLEHVSCRTGCCRPLTATKSVSDGPAPNGRTSACRSPRPSRCPARRADEYDLPAGWSPSRRLR